MSKASSVEEIEAVLAARPNDHALRRDLIDILLSQREAERAVAHFEVLVQQLPHERWVVEFGIEVMAVAGDNLRAARLKKRLREIDTADENDDNAGPHPGHPSQDKASVRHLSLVRGASESAERHDGVGFHTELRLADVAGLAAVKAQLERLLAQVTTEAAARTGWPGGVLLYGPPSCGKAVCGEVVAGELGALFWYVDLQDTWDKEGLEEIIASATEQGTKAHPSVLYLDNLDYLGNIETKQLIPALEDAAFQKTMIVFGAATFPWKVSSDLVTPTRISEVLLVLPPDAPARQLFLEQRLNGRSSLRDDDLEWMVQHTEGHSFGDLERLMDLALLTDEATGEYVSHQALRTARQRISASSAEWLTVAGHHAMMSESGGLYDDLIAYFANRQKV